MNFAKIAILTVFVGAHQGYGNSDDQILVHSLSGKVASDFILTKKKNYYKTVPGDVIKVSPSAEGLTMTLDSSEVNTFSDWHDPTNVVNPEIAFGVENELKGYTCAVSMKKKEIIKDNGGRSSSDYLLNLETGTFSVTGMPGFVPYVDKERGFVDYQNDTEEFLFKKDVLFVDRQAAEKVADIKVMKEFSSEDQILSFAVEDSNNIVKSFYCFGKNLESLTLAELMGMFGLQIDGAEVSAPLWNEGTSQDNEALVDEGVRSESTAAH